MSASSLNFNAAAVLKDYVPAFENALKPIHQANGHQTRAIVIQRYYRLKATLFSAKVLGHLPMSLTFQTKTTSRYAISWACPLLWSAIVMTTFVCSTMFAVIVG